MTRKKDLKIKMALALRDELSELSAGMRAILIDDLVCAFESRLKVLARAEAHTDFEMNFEEIYA